MHSDVAYLLLKGESQHLKCENFIFHNFLTVNMNKGKLFILKLRAVGVIEACRGEYASLKGRQRRLKAAIRSSVPKLAS